MKDSEDTGSAMGKVQGHGDGSGGTTQHRVAALGQRGPGNTVHKEPCLKARLKPGQEPFHLVALKPCLQQVSASQGRNEAGSKAGASPGKKVNSF